MVALGVAAAMVVAGAAVWRWRAPATPPLNPRRYVVLPFRHIGNPGTGRLNGDGCARMLGDAMSRWRGVLVTNEMVVNDVWTLKRPVTVADAMRAARSLGAGRVAWGTVVSVADTVEVRAAVYDASDGEPSGRQYIVTLRGAKANLDSAFAALADSILVGGRLADAPVAAIGTTSVDAVRKFLDGREAMGHFDLRTAERHFAEAAALDDGYALAHLWFARTLAWEGAVDPSAWEPMAARAVAHGATLPPSERLHAQALLDLAMGQMPSACSRYRALISRDSTDFGAWLGLGDCQARDTLVVRDPRSPTGWSFRGSYHTAIGAYRRALTLVPSFHSAERGAAFGRLSNRVLFVEELRRRGGYSAAPEPTRFVAFPSFLADTLGFVPHPYASPGARVAARPASGGQAISWSIGVYRELMAQWAAAFPADADAQESYALALEASAGIPGQEGEVPEALDHARRAQRLADSTRQQVRLSATVTRLLLKNGDVDGARAAADSALRAYPAPGPYEAGYLAGLAALTGRARRTAQLLATASEEQEHQPFVTAEGRRALIPPTLASSALALRGYAALGGPRDSLKATYDRVQRLIDERVPAPQRPGMRTMLLGWSLGLAYTELLPVVREPVDPGLNLVLAMRSALAAGDTAATRRVSAELRARAARFTIGVPDIDGVYQNALVIGQLGDDTLAARMLDEALSGLPRSRRILLLVVSQAAAVPRAMLLRAELASRAGDPASFERWARSATVLWGDADPELREPIDALRSRLRRQ
jgi:tetratricopeptide (TPR) repeat protein/TolB-like protein